MALAKRAAEAAVPLSALWAALAMVAQQALEHPIMAAVVAVVPDSTGPEVMAPTQRKPQAGAAQQAQVDQMVTVVFQFRERVDQLQACQTLQAQRFDFEVILQEVQAVKGLR